MLCAPPNRATKHILMIDQVLIGQVLIGQVLIGQVLIGQASLR